MNSQDQISLFWKPLPLILSFHRRQQTNTQEGTRTEKKHLKKEAQSFSHSFSFHIRFSSNTSLIRSVFVVIRRQLPIFPILGLAFGAYFLQQFHHPPHGGAVDRQRAGAEEANVEHFAYLLLETRIELWVEYMVYAFLVKSSANPLDQILFPEFGVHWEPPGD